MILTLLAIVLGALIFLFVIHVFCRDDFVLFRRNISLEHIFNAAFITLAVAAFFSRFFYVIFHFKRGFLNPLVFFHIFNYPGLSLTGAVLASAIFLLFFSRGKKYPRGRILDIFSLAFLYALFLPQLLLLVMYPKSLQFVIILASSILYLICAAILTRFYLNAKLKEGTISIAALFIFALISTVTFGLFHKVAFAYTSLEFGLLAFTSIFSFLFLMLQLYRK